MAHDLLRSTIIDFCLTLIGNGGGSQRVPVECIPADIGCSTSRNDGDIWREYLGYDKYLRDILDVICYDLLGMAACLPHMFPLVA